jgi:hypothetical protein
MVVQHWHFFQWNLEPRHRQTLRPSRLSSSVHQGRYGPVLVVSECHCRSGGHGRRPAVVASTGRPVVTGAVRGQCKFVGLWPQSPPWCAGVGPSGWYSRPGGRASVCQVDGHGRRPGVINVNRSPITIVFWRGWLRQSVAGGRWLLSWRSQSCRSSRSVVTVVVLA